MTILLAHPVAKRFEAIATLAGGLRWERMPTMRRLASVSTRRAVYDVLYNPQQTISDDWLCSLTIGSLTFAVLWM